jgi:hypothetical protein
MNQSNPSCWFLTGLMQPGWAFLTYTLIAGISAVGKFFYIGAFDIYKLDTGV